MRRRLSILLIVLFIAVCGGLAVAQQSPDRANILREIETLRAELRAREEAFLSPAPEDRLAFAEYLRGADAGLVRLLPRERYERSGLLTIRGGGAYYSFSRLSHEYGYGSDIELQQGKLSVGFAGADYGMLAVLGDVPLEQVTVESPELEFLLSYEPATTLAAARAEQRRTSAGLEAGGHTYRRALPAIVNRTYVLRSICYEGSDSLVAFRILRQDTDGSLIIGWRLLRRYTVPRLERETGAAQPATGR